MEKMKMLVKKKKNTFYEQIKQGIGDWEGNQNADIEEY